MIMRLLDHYCRRRGIRLNPKAMTTVQSSELREIFLALPFRLRFPSFSKKLPLAARNIDASPSAPKTLSSLTTIDCLSFLVHYSQDSSHFLTYLSFFSGGINWHSKVQAFRVPYPSTNSFSAKFLMAEQNGDEKITNGARYGFQLPSVC
jgi:hypothetical protein